MKYILPSIIISFLAIVSYAQGDGPRSYLLAPKGVTGINAKWLNLNQNITPANIFAPGASVNVNVYPVTLFHTFSITGKYAQVYFMLNPGSASATATNIPPVLPIPTGTKLSASGFSDGFAGFRMGLTGAPSLRVANFLNEKMQFSLFADLRFWYSGTYDAKKILNMGSNRNTIEFSLPMAIPLNKNRAKATWLEISPSVEFFTANNNPSRSNLLAKKITQAPLFMLENHLTHNFNKKFWGSASLRYRQGGATSVDGKSDENETKILGVAAGLGYQLLPYLGINSDYGTVLWGYNKAQSNMLRLTVLFTYANLKKK